MYNLIRTLLYICIVLIIFLIMRHFYSDNDTDKNNLMQNINLYSPEQELTNNTYFSDIFDRISILNNLKEQFGNATTSISDSDLLNIYQTLGIRGNELNNLNLSIASYAEQIAQNTALKEPDRQQTINLLSQIYSTKLNDSINKLNQVAYNEYLKSKQNQVQFKV